MGYIKQDRLTSKSYWENYYSNHYAEASKIVSVCSYYDNYWDTLLGEDSKDKSLIEIGGYPGRYLAYLSHKYGVVPTCLDFNSDTSQIDGTFAAMGVKNYSIIQEDVLSYEPQERYDYVISNGFIEHFEDYDTVLDLHMQYLKSEGKLLVMIPNMKGYVKLYKSLVDKKNLKIHNLKSMSLKTFELFAKRHNLEVLELRYFGEFPHTVHQDLNTFQTFLYKIHRLLFKKWLNTFVVKYPSKYFSSGIIAIYKYS